MTTPSFNLTLNQSQIAPTHNEILNSAVQDEPFRRSSSFIKEGNSASIAEERVGNYADLVVLLRERDVTVLRSWFSNEEMFQIETDIIQNLLRVFPEPCWEEDPFEFLRDFL